MRAYLGGYRGVLGGVWRCLKEWVEVCGSVGRSV